MTDKQVEALRDLVDYLAADRQVEREVSLLKYAGILEGEGTEDMKAEARGVIDGISHEIRQIQRLRNAMQSKR